MKRHNVDPTEAQELLSKKIKSDIEYLMENPVQGPSTLFEENPKLYSKMAVILLTAG